MTPEQQKRLQALFEMVVKNVVKDADRADLFILALDIMLHGCYNIVIGGDDPCTDVDDTIIDLVGPGTVGNG